MSGHLQFSYGAVRDNLFWLLVRREFSLEFGVREQFVHEHQNQFGAIQCEMARVPLLFVPRWFMQQRWIQLVECYRACAARAHAPATRAVLDELETRLLLEVGLDVKL